MVALDSLSGDNAEERELNRELREPHGYAASGVGVPGRRTITIQGRGAERYRGMPERRQPSRRPHERAGFKADRAAMWAVLLGVLMILAAATSSHAAMVARHDSRAQVRLPAAAHSLAAPSRVRPGAHLRLRPAR